MKKSIEEFLKDAAVEYQELVFDVPFETTVHSAEMLGTDMEHIAKTLLFRAPFGAIVIIASGVAKVDNKKFKERFEIRPTMLNAKELFELTGFEPGSVSPIGIASEKLHVYMDASLAAFKGENVFPSCGTDRSALSIKPEALFKAAKCEGMVDVCK